jgi:predicted outer membrane repeat protein
MDGIRESESIMFGGSRTGSRRRAALFACLAAGAVGLVAGCSENPSGPGDGTPETIVVDAGGGGDFLTIGAAIEAVSEGDTVLVMPGVYSGAANRDLDFEGVNIVLRAASARDSTVIDCEGEGRALHFHGGEGAGSVVEGFVIRNGTAAQGGAIRCEGSSPTITGVVFRSNTATRNGGAIYCDESSPTLTDVTFRGNAVEGALAESGGAVFCLDSSPVISDATFIDNAAASGGAIGCVFSSPSITSATFIGNEASSAGGALYAAGSNERRADPAIVACVFIANSAWRGGAIALSSSAASVGNGTFARNTAIEGGGIFCENGSDPSIARTIIAFSNGGGALACFSESAPSITRSCIYGNAGGDDLCGTYSDNLSDDPLFCDMNEDDVSLCENSPCLSANNTWGVLMGARTVGCSECEESRR